MLPSTKNHHTEHTKTTLHRPIIWPRAIALVDMNAFFSSIEQRDQVEWRRRPVAFANGRQDTCIITCSYEARPYGIKTGTLPLGGWPRLDIIYAGRWGRWFPVLVKIPVKSFMEKDQEGHSRWFDLTRGQRIQGLVARYQHEHRVYVVTVEPELAEAVHDCWPLASSALASQHSLNGWTAC